MGTNCAPLLADLFISVFVPTKSYFILGHLTKNGKKLAKSLGLQQNTSNAMDAGTIYSSRAPEITTVFSRICVVGSVMSR
jgi:ethanolamine utilization microcompartment shell protein EutS